MNLIDVIILIALAYYAWKGFQTGFVGGVLNLAATLIALYIAIYNFSWLGSFLAGQFNVGENTSKIAAFLALAIGIDILLSYLFNFFRSFLMKQIQNSFLAPLYVADKVVGIIPSVLISSLLVSTFIFVAVNLPFNNGLKQTAQDSFWNHNMMPVFYRLIPQTQKLLSKLPYENLQQLLISNRPYIQIPGQSQIIHDKESIKLKPTTQTTFSINRVDEDKMIELVNKERKAQSLGELKQDFTMVEVARAHSLDMIKRAYFSHYDPDGKSPADRMDAGGARYALAGENLACAYSVEAAHEGLMKSPGHRENILRKEFGRIGIGVYDGGECGKMFTQTFAD